MDVPSPNLVYMILYAYCYCALPPHKCADISTLILRHYLPTELGKEAPCAMSDGACFLLNYKFH